MKSAFGPLFASLHFHLFSSCPDLQHAVQNHGQFDAAACG